MLRSILLWLLAFLITIGTAVYQRKTGPTWPIEGNINIAGEDIEYVLTTSHGGPGDQEIAVGVGDLPIEGRLHYKKYKVPEKFIVIDMERSGDSLKAALPHQPPAGKLEYYVELIHGGNSLIIPGHETAVTRFKGGVPLTVLIPHVVFIFTAMLFSTRTGLQAIRSEGRTYKLTLATFILLGLGGMILGPAVQKYAFGEFWTGVPFGWDLTDNKTLIAFIGWAFALIRHRYVDRPRWAVLTAAVIQTIIFMIPHSVLGSELDYSTGEVTTGGKL